MPEPTPVTPSSPSPAAPTPPSDKPSASATATETRTQTKTKTVIAVGLIAGAAMGVAAAFALISLPRPVAKVCVGGPVAGRSCTSDKQCLGGRCMAKAAPTMPTKPAVKPTTKPATKPATVPATRPATMPATKPATKPATLRNLPTVSLAPLPSTVLQNSANAIIARFTVTADASRAVSLKKISFMATVSDTGSNGTLSNVSVRSVGEGTNLTSIASATSKGANCGFTASSRQQCVRVLLADEHVVAAGTSKTFELRANLANFDHAGDALAVTMLGDKKAAVGELDLGTGLAPALQIDAVVSGTDGEYNFIWSDMSDRSHNVNIATNMRTDALNSSNDWTNGYGVSRLPSDSQTLVKN
ncbi:hypothetical protein HY633_05100 [Candidatus Uhrbacteria bacterium]|nr:hypothetical protein [Candidatus Uhrbacteria bacterium]